MKPTNGLVHWYGALCKAHEIAERSLSAKRNHTTREGFMGLVEHELTQVYGVGMEEAEVLARSAVLLIEKRMTA
jgi:hypothetical protein